MNQYSYNYYPKKTQDFRQSQITSEGFHKWTKDNMYRTSYSTMSHRQPVQPKNVVYKGYGGFIPGLQSENKYGKNYSAITRDCFSDKKLGYNTHKLATTGFNFKRHDFIDHSLTASTHTYGKSTIQKPHPCLDSQNWKSVTHSAFRSPQHQVNPTFRQTDKNLQTLKYKTLTSGFQQNHEQFDRKGWIPEKVLHGDRTKTEYRVRYNVDKPYHRNTHLDKTRTLARPEYNYKYT
ncbi:hypothetical protein PPERSA_03509 [Pseudocohnilembus persalinus]|uniref:Uncharacterized protein n=1 Tax=Pseudocohnilembus persalinus TaxID=266149 RepID=A0A0V0R295_PSEPJ|nr:hypothetical protein PPERSA_03509 [Pseudocohnilembus persalinus]|eukprot:KRX08638.1 hypothetical protein PPERSA_03509 [Pseudocohnilembus persalinus]